MRSGSISPTTSELSRRGRPNQVDVLFWSDHWGTDSRWLLGRIGYLKPSVHLAANSLSRAVDESSADYLLLWRAGQRLPDEKLLVRLMNDGIDLAHCGLKQGLGTLMPHLNLIMQDWSMINAPDDLPSSSWRMSLDSCFIRRDLLLKLGGLDPAFSSLSAAGLDLAYRCLRKGALVEHRPELWTSGRKLQAPEPPATDLYTFILRHYGNRWAQYIALRRSLNPTSTLREWRFLRQACRSCSTIPAPAATAQAVWCGFTPSADSDRLSQTRVSVIIPTLGRYPYLPRALSSLRTQTIKPHEVIVVDQNPPEARQLEVYQGYDDLNLRIIWQDERGQSLARNTGLASATCPYILLFDDDSIAYNNLIESHLSMVVGRRFDVSTGVSFPSPPTAYQLPLGFRYPRVAQTFDTGNSLMPLSLARELGGLDRNYDFGPGTDLDLGTRLYLAGQRILHNPQAVRIHFKAPIGGLRVHGANKYNTDAGLLEPFPHITQTYYGLRYLNRQQLRERVLLQFVTSKFPREVRRRDVELKQRLKAFLSFILSAILFPLKWKRSYDKARFLLEQGPQLTNFGHAGNSSHVGTKPISHHQSDATAN